MLMFITTYILSIRNIHSVIFHEIPANTTQNLNRTKGVYLRFTFDSNDEWYGVNKTHTIVRQVQHRISTPRKHRNMVQRDTKRKHK